MTSPFFLSATVVYVCKDGYVCNLDLLTFRIYIIISCFSSDFTFFFTWCCFTLCAALSYFNFFFFTHKRKRRVNEMKVDAIGFEWRVVLIFQLLFFFLYCLSKEREKCSVYNVDEYVKLRIDVFFFWIRLRIYVY